MKLAVVKLNVLFLILNCSIAFAELITENSNELDISKPSSTYLTPETISDGATVTALLLCNKNGIVKPSDPVVVNEGTVIPVIRMKTGSAIRIVNADIPPRGKFENVRCVPGASERYIKIQVLKYKTVGI